MAMLNKQAFTTIGRILQRACSQMAVWIMRIVTYPFRWVALLFARMVRLCATILPPVLLSGILLAAIVWMESEHGSAWKAVEQYLDKVIGGGNQVQLVSLLTSAGIFGWALKKLGKAAWDGILEIRDLFVGALEGRWWPSLKVAESLQDIWEHLCDVREAFVDSLGSFGKLALVLIAATPFVLALIPNKAIPAGERIHVVVTDVSQAFASKVYLRDGAVFSLLHSENAKMSPPDSGEGVCLEGATLDWLTKFRAGVKRCMMESSEDLDCGNAGKPCPVLEVTGYASVAPERAGQLAGLCPAAPAGKSFNCKVANLRALAVGAFLAAKSDVESKKWACPSDKENYWRASVCPAEDCPAGGSAAGYIDEVMRTADGKRSIGIRVRQWASEEEMKAGKPAADGELPDQRRYRVEVLNRAVHIKVLEDFCQSSL